MLLRSYLNLIKVFWIYFNSQSKKHLVLQLPRPSSLFSSLQYHVKTLISDILGRPSDNSVPRREISKSSWKKKRKSQHWPSTPYVRVTLSAGNRLNFYPRMEIGAIIVFSKPGKFIFVESKSSTGTMAFNYVMNN